jgi:SAM-dependent methyltransferase
MSPSVPVTIARLVLRGASDEQIRAALRAQPDALAMFEARLPAVERMRAMLAHVDHASASDLARIAAQFDAAVAAAPEASVASYSLGDPALLDAATAEVAGWLRTKRLFVRGMDVLDLGCGFGRIAASLAPAAASVLGIDVSPGMIEEARRRYGAAPHLGFEVAPGTDLGSLPTAAFDLVVAVDSFPYLFQAGAAIARRHIMDAARVLRIGGALVILNLAYGVNRRAEAVTWAVEVGFQVEIDGVRPFTLWDGEAFVLRRR